MAKLVIKISFILVLLIVFSIQGSTGLEQWNQFQSDKVRIKNHEFQTSLNLSPECGKIPLYFIPNEGQVDERALFYAKTSRYSLWMTKEGLVFDSIKRTQKESTKSMRRSPRDENDLENFNYEREVSKLFFINANSNPEVISDGNTEHNANYLIGNDESQWRTNIQTSSAVMYKELYPYIDLKVYGVEQQIEYDFIVKPGGKVSDICFEYEDVEKTRIDVGGNLVISTGFGELEHSRPVCYQVIEGKRAEIAANFKKIENTAYGFNIGEYNRNYDLIIDPVVLVYSTYLGGSGTDYEATGIAVDSEGAVYVTGSTMSRNFPKKIRFKKCMGEIAISS
ncbi:MAG: SBBP repeat-containing protein [Candidatus Aminicenantaceae bacterium]